MDIKLHSTQHDFVFNDAHYSAFVAGIGAGKSMAGCVRGLLAGLGQVGTKRITAPNVGVIIAPSYRMLRDSSMRTFLEVAGELVVEVRKTDMALTLANGSEVLLRSADEADTLRGPNISWAFLDEAALMEHLAFNVMIGRCRQFGLHGYTWLATTPRGRNWVYSEFAAKPRASHALFTTRTADNPFLSPEYFASLTASYSSDFAAQELDGQFLAHRGAIYSEFRRDKHVVERPLDEMKYTVAGVDWGYKHAGVILLVGVDYDGAAHVFYEEYVRERHIDDWAQVAGQLARQFNVTTAYADPSQPTFIEQFTAAGMLTVQADNSVMPGINAVKVRLVPHGQGTPRLTIAPSCVNLIAELETYSWSEGRDGLSKDQPRKQGDDAADALRYVIRSIDDEIDPETMALFPGVIHANYGSFSTSPY